MLNLGQLHDNFNLTMRYPTDKATAASMPAATIATAAAATAATAAAALGWRPLSICYWRTGRNAFDELVQVYSIK